MGQLTEFSTESLLDALGVVSSVLADHAEAIDSLEMRVDESANGAGDTIGDGAIRVPEGAGTDMAATLESACGRSAGARDLRSAVSELRDGAQLGARGKAGRGLAAVFEALAEVTTNTDTVDGERFALALELAAVNLLAGVDAPEVGTLPAVISAAANGALTALDQKLPLGDILISASDDGLAELEDGPVANRVLAERGTVDSAAAGFLLVLDALSAIVTDEPLPAAPREHKDLLSHGDFTEPPGGESQRFVIRCQVQPLEGCGVEAAAWLESTWHEIGRLVEFHVGPDRWNVHLHTTLPGSAVEALCSVGIPTELHIGVVADDSGASAGSD